LLVEPPDADQEEAVWDFTLAEMERRCTTDPKGLFDSIMHAINTRNEYQEENERLQRQVEGLKIDRRGLEALIQSDRASKPDQPQTRTTKLPDPPVLTDGKDPKFTDWLSKMKAKLRANADHYTTEDLRMAYVENRTGGDAARHLAPYLEDEEHQFQTAKEMLDCLAAIYLDPNRRENARSDFKKLTMKDNEDFHLFLTKFLHLSSEAKVPKENLAEELRDRLTMQLRTLTLVSYLEKKTFAEFRQICSQVAQGIKGINEAELRRTPHQSAAKLTAAKTPFVAAKKTVPASRYLTSTTAPLPTPDNTPAVKKERSLRAEQMTLMKEGKCFRCKGEGHMAKDCPTNTLPGIKAMQAGHTEEFSDSESGNEET
jgi:hypothetical protein